MANETDASHEKTRIKGSNAFFAKQRQAAATATRTSKKNKESLRKRKGRETEDKWVGGRRGEEKEVGKRVNKARPGIVMHGGHTR